MRIARHSAVDFQRVLMERVGIYGAKTASEFVQSLRRGVKVRSPIDVTPSPVELARMASRIGRIDVRT